jgi:hypothetical protein
MEIRKQRTPLLVRIKRFWFRDCKVSVVLWEADV